MKKTLLLVIAVLMTFSLATAQTTKIVIGPLSGDNAGPIVADTNQVLSIPLWIRTEPGINIVALHFPLGSNDMYIQPGSRQSGSVFSPFEEWDDVGFLTPNIDSLHLGYSNQSILGVKDLIGNPDSLDGIRTEGQWWRIATFVMRTQSWGDGEAHDDAFIVGFQRFNGGMVWADYLSGEIDNEDIETDFATLQLPDVGTGVDEEIVDLPTEFSLKQNYPNPFNASTTISYNLPQSSDVTIEIYDIMGRRIKTLVSGYQPAGEQSVIWNASDVSSGIYLYRIVAGDFVQTKRCNLLK